MKKSIIKLVLIFLCSLLLVLLDMILVDQLAKNKLGLIEVYVAKNLVPSKQHLDPNEFVNVELHTVEELKQMIFDGEIEDSKTVASILAYDAKYNRK